MTGLSTLFDPAITRRLIVKIGSSLLVTEDGAIRTSWLESLMSDLLTMRNRGQEILIVSSGAVALGARKLRLPRGGRSSLEDSQAAASVGQVVLAHCYTDLLEKHRLQGAQILLTLEDLEVRRRYLNISATMNRLLALNVIPIINENDSVATEELRFGDNDRLAARIAQACLASGVILMSDVDGLYTADPKLDPSARLVKNVDRITAQLEATAGGADHNAMGRGGMVSKIQAARIATHSGCRLAIINGTHDSPLKRAMDRDMGTVFEPEMTPLAARKAWIAGRQTSAGRLTVDAGAALALLDGKSLLPVGVQTVEGSFKRGDIVQVVDAHGKVLGHGLSEYAAEDARRIKGLAKSAVQKELGYSRSSLIHRNNLSLIT